MLGIFCGRYVDGREWQPTTKLPLLKYKPSEILKLPKFKDELDQNMFKPPASLPKSSRSPLALPQNPCFVLDMFNFFKVPVAVTGITAKLT